MLYEVITHEFRCACAQIREDGGDFAHEKLSPVLAMYKAKNFSDAVSKAERLVADGGYGHTASLYVNAFVRPAELPQER